MRVIMSSVLIALSAACGPSGQNAQGPAANQGAAESTGNQVAALSEGQRNAVFIRAIRDAGLECQHVQSSSPAGTYRGMPVWRATCRGNRHWTIVIGANGEAQILNADEATLVTDTNTSAGSQR